MIKIILQRVEKVPQVVRSYFRIPKSLSIHVVFAYLLAVAAIVSVNVQLSKITKNLTLIEEKLYDVHNELEMIKSEMDDISFKIPY